MEQQDQRGHSAFAVRAGHSEAGISGRRAATPRHGRARSLRARMGGLLASALVALAAPALAADWYAAPSGSGSACTQAAPCTIQGAIDAASANDTVHVAPGNYAFVSPGIEINKAGLTLIGDNSPFALPFSENPVPGVSVAYGTQNNKAANASVLTSATSGSGDDRHLIWVKNAPGSIIKNLYFEQNLARAREAIVVTGNPDGLVIENNYIKFSSSGKDRFGISITPTSGAGMQSSVGFLSSSGGRFVTIRDNVLEPTISGSSSSAPKRAILFNLQTGLIEGNQMASSTADLWVYQGSASVSGPFTIRNNWFFGRLQGQINGFDGQTTEVVIENNHFIAPGSSFSPVSLPGVNPGTLTSAESHMLRLAASQTAPTKVRGNQFKGFINQYRALWVQSRRNVEITDSNVFTPEPTATDFTAITVGNRMVQSSLNTPVAFG